MARSPSPTYAPTMKAMRPTLCPNSESNDPFILSSPPSVAGFDAPETGLPGFGLERAARVRAGVRLLVALPCVARPDLEPLRYAPHPHFPPQCHQRPKPLRDHQPSLRVQFHRLGAPEEHPRVGPRLLPAQGASPDLGAPPLPLVRGVGEEAPVLAERQIHALGERLPELHGQRDAPLGIQLIAVLAEQFSHCVPFSSTEPHVYATRTPPRQEGIGTFRARLRKWGRGRRPQGRGG